MKNAIAFVKYALYRENGIYCVWGKQLTVLFEYGTEYLKKKLKQ